MSCSYTFTFCSVQSWVKIAVASGSPDCKPIGHHAPEHLNLLVLREAGDVLPPREKSGARCRVRTCDFLRVKQALYH